MYSWKVEEADRQTPSETPYGKDSYGETKNSEIIIVHVVHAGVDRDSLRKQGLTAAKAAGYDESGHRDDESGLRINCTVAVDASAGTILVWLRAPEA